MKLLFVHGAGGTRAIWHLQLHRFKDAGAPDLPGHPEGEGRHSITEYADFIENYMKQNRVETPALVGHSMGGAIAIELALRGVALGALVLVGTGARLRVNPDIFSKLKANYREACQMLAKWSVSSSAEPYVVDQIAKDMQRIRQDVTLADFQACDEFDRMDAVETIRCPTLIICGQEDRLTPPKYSSYLHERIRNSKLSVIPNAGHCVMVERHTAFNEALANLLGSQ